jgi:DNA-binding NarL/FixJ family response regulator
VTIRVVLVDDQPLLRQGFRMILEAEADIEVIAEAGDGAAAAELAGTYRPDVVLMDVRMPGVDGIEGTRRIVADTPEVRVLVLTTFDLDAYVFGAIRAGASGFLLKDVRPAELVNAIRRVAGGDAVLSPQVTRHLLDELGPLLPDPAQSSDGRLQLLTDREREVLVAVSEGLSNQEIADRLYLSEATIKSHVSRVLSKLGLRDRVQAVIFAFEAGLVRPNDRRG